MSMLQNYRGFIKFLSLYLGSSTEIIIYDTEKIVAVENAISAKHKVGEPLGEMELIFIEEERFKFTDNVMNYRALSSDGDKLRSATFFITDEEGNLEGMLSINRDVGKLIGVRDLIQSLINGEHTEDPLVDQDRHRYFETFDGSFEDLMNSVITKHIARYMVSPDRLRPEEKIEIVRILDEKGIFLIKGSVLEVAKRLNSSEATIYRYLNQITT